MLHEIRNRELLAAFEFNGHEIDGLGEEFVVDAGHVGEIARVADSAIQPAQALELGPPLAHDGFVKRLHLPLLLVLGEYLHGVEPKPLGLAGGGREAGGNGEVGAEHHSV